MRIFGFEINKISDVDMSEAENLCLTITSIDNLTNVLLENFNLDGSKIRNREFLAHVATDLMYIDALINIYINNRFSQPVNQLMLLRYKDNLSLACERYSNIMDEMFNAFQKYEYDSEIENVLGEYANKLFRSSIEIRSNLYYIKHMLSHDLMFNMTQNDAIKQRIKDFYKRNKKTKTTIKEYVKPALKFNIMYVNKNDYEKLSQRKDVQKK